MNEADTAKEMLDTEKISKVYEAYNEIGSEIILAVALTNISETLDEIRDILKEGLALKK